jgi:hypothetical protein
MHPLTARCPFCRSLQPWVAIPLQTLAGLALLTVLGLGGWSLYKMDRAEAQDKQAVSHPPRNEAGLAENPAVENAPRKVWFRKRPAIPGRQNVKGQAKDDDLKPSEKAVRDFGADGVSFATTLQSFVAQGHGATQTTKAMGKSSYEWQGAAGARYGVTFSLFNVDCLVVMEDEKEYDAILSECREKLGPPSREDKGVGADESSFLFWDFPAVQRAVSLGKIPDNGRVRAYLSVSAAY